uniref:Uncharacterized protein n=1 Tax=Zosterops lateralis melanops TaxID=1220523 RepID=A0A8D2PZV1_ZOSLA
MVFSIFAFATCGGFEGSVTFRVTCAGEQENHSVTATFGYPFRLNEAVFRPSLTDLCNHTWPKDIHLVGDFSSGSRFFVGVAVVAFLYSLGALGGYLGYLHLYRCAGSRLPTMVSVLRCAQVCSGVLPGLPAPVQVCGVTASSHGECAQVCPGVLRCAQLCYLGYLHLYRCAGSR